MSSQYKISTVLQEEYIVGLHSSQRDFNFKGKFLAPFQSGSDVKCEHCGYCHCSSLIVPFLSILTGVNGSREPPVEDTASPQRTRRSCDRALQSRAHQSGLFWHRIFMSRTVLKLPVLLKTHKRGFLASGFENLGNKFYVAIWREHLT